MQVVGKGRQMPPSRELNVAISADWIQRFRTKPTPTHPAARIKQNTAREECCCADLKVSGSGAEAMEAFHLAIDPSCVKLKGGLGDRYCVGLRAKDSQDSPVGRVENALRTCI